MNVEQQLLDLEKFSERSFSVRPPLIAGAESGRLDFARPEKLDEKPLSVKEVMSQLNTDLREAGDQKTKEMAEQAISALSSLGSDVGGLSDRVQSIESMVPHVPDHNGEGFTWTAPITQSPEASSVQTDSEGTGDTFSIEHDAYEQLATKYLVRPEVNHKRLVKHYPKACIQNVSDLITNLSAEKERIKDKAYKHQVLNWLCDKRMRRKLHVKKKYVMGKREKLISNQGLGYWLA